MIQEISIIQETVKITLVNLGEGINGYYDSDDPDDVNLLRFDVSKFDDATVSWVEVPDASYCTQIPATISYATGYQLLQIIMNELYPSIVNGEPIKKMCERLSWIDENGAY